MLQATPAAARLWLVVALAAVLTSSCATTAHFTAVDTAKVDRLLGLIQERLDAAPEVARAKWNTKAPIDDPPRDEEIIDGAAKAAPEFGLDPQVARTFFLGQIQASKAVQSALHVEWTAKSQPPFAKVADLGADIRPVLDRLTPVMLRALAEALPILQHSGGRQLLDAQTKASLSRAPRSEAAVRVAVAPLLTLSR